MADNKRYIVIDAGGTFLKSAIMDKTGSILKGSMSMDKSHSESPKELVLSTLLNVIERKRIIIMKKGFELGGIGIAFPGPFNYALGTSMMTHKYGSINGLNLKKIISDSLNLDKNIPLIFKHDANSVLEGEIWKGNAIEFSNSALITLGTGLGFACAIGGEVKTNEIGGPYITIFKLPYNDGILEDYVSRRGFLKIYNELKGGNIPQNFDVSDIALLACDGDESAIETFEKVGSIVASAIKPILINNKIECLLFAGQISQSFIYMEKSIKTALSEVKSLKKISCADSIETAALTGLMKSFTT